jgi:ATP-dependent exoDNAse (exonuclease V) alpha subunit
MMRRNDARLGLCNGQTGSIIAVDRVDLSLTIAADDGACRVVPLPYTAAGNIQHAYATTIHKAQGQTVDRCLVLADGLLYRESAYVALSRGRAQNHLYIVSDGVDVENAAHGPTWQRDPLPALRDLLATSRSQTLALDQLDRRARERDLGMEVEIPFP